MTIEVGQSDVIQKGLNSPLNTERVTENGKLLKDGNGKEMDS